MSTGVRLRGVWPLALLLVLAGCKEQAANQSGPGPAPAAQGPTREDVRQGVGKMLPSVQRHDAGMDLRNIAQLYFADAQLGSPPKKVEDLKGLDAKTVQAIKDGIYVVLWNANPNAPGTAIVAFEKNVPKNGGMVADMTGSVKKMTPQEFLAAPKAAAQ
jgi:hypothetical protein